MKLIKALTKAFLMIAFLFGGATIMRSFPPWLYHVVGIGGLLLLFSFLVWFFYPDK